jgi:GT2 family glycosyltransferase
MALERPGNSLSEERPRLSVVIVNWNTSELLQECLRSLFQYPAQNSFEVIVVDNGSTDDSASMLRASFPDVRLICNATNRGFAAANNQGIAASRGELVLLLNSDTQVLQGALDRLIGAATEFPQAGVIGCRLLNPDGTLQHSVLQFLTLPKAILASLGIKKISLGRYSYTAHGLIADWSYDAVRQVDYVKGACMLIRRSTLEQVGLLDESFFMYAEEADYCYRVRNAGWAVLFYPDAEVTHWGGQSAQQVAPETAARRAVSLWLFHKKHYGSIHAAIYRMMAILINSVRLCAQALRIPFRGKQHTDWEVYACKLRALVTGKAP